MSTHPIGPSGQPPGVPPKPAPRKPPAKRLFSGMAGSPLARVDEAQKPAQAPVAVVAVREPQPTPVSVPVPQIAKITFPLFQRSSTPALIRCEHGMYDPHGDQKYCTVCNPVLVDAKIQKNRKYTTKIALVVSKPTTQRFEVEINKALASARSQLLGPEGRKDFADLKQIAITEIWEAINRYGERINEKLAYRIAKSQANKFLNQRKKRGFAQVPKDAKPHLQSLNDRPETAEAFSGEEMEHSPAELEIAERQREGIRFWELDVPGTAKGADWMQALEERGGIAELAALVNSWTGVKRIIGEFLLEHPDSTVRDTPGVPKSTTARFRRTILADFEEFVRDGTK